MRTIVAAGLALFLSWSCAIGLRKLGEVRIKAWAPFWEELFKNGLSWLFGGALWGVHGLFGLGEALYEWKDNKGMLLFLVNILAHLCFGGVAVLLMPIGRWAGWLGSTAVHLVWNILILTASSKKNQ